MDNRQVPIFITAMAEIALLEGMKVENKEREIAGEALTYSEDHFYAIQYNLLNLARAARG
jgi:hypothetical protein